MSDEVVYKRNDLGQFIEKPKTAKVFDSESGRAAVRSRWEKRRNAADIAVIDKAEQMGLEVSDSAAAFGALVAHHYELLMKSGRADIYQVKELLKLLTGADSLEYSQRTNESGGGGGSPPAGTVAASPDTLIELVRLLEDEIETRKIKAQAIDAE